MWKSVNGVLKYFLLSVTYAVGYVLLILLTNTKVDIKEAIFSLTILFILLCVFALVTPFLRKLFGFKK